MFLNWITQSVKQAVLKGFQEAADELELTADQVSPLDALKERMKPVAAITHEAGGKARKRSD